MVFQRMKSICDDFDYTIKDDLIQNTNPISIIEAQQLEPVIALRWRYRICRIMGKTFDITKEGLFYTCEEALEG